MSGEEDRDNRIGSGLFNQPIQFCNKRCACCGLVQEQMCVCGIITACGFVGEDLEDVSRIVVCFAELGQVR